MCRLKVSEDQATACSVNHAQVGCGRPSHQSTFVCWQRLVSTHTAPLELDLGISGQRSIYLDGGLCLAYVVSVYVTTLSC